MTDQEDSDSFDYREKMTAIYYGRHARNPAYSLTAFARDLGMGAPMLSLVLSKKRTLSFKKASKIVHRMGLSARDIALFMRSVKHISGKKESALYQSPKSESSAEHPQNISLANIDFTVTWRHALIRELVHLTSFELSAKSLAKKLEVDEAQAQQIFEECLRAGFIHRDPQGKYQALEHIVWGDRGANDNLRLLHKDLIGKAVDKIDGAMSERSVSASLVSVSEAQYEEIRRLVRFFNSELVRAMKIEDTGCKDRVVCIATQIYQM